MLKAIIKNVSINRKSGLVVAIVNIPLSISLGIASGATPLQSLLTAIWAGLLASIFASSKHNIFGPAGALSGILFAFALSRGYLSLPLIAIGSGLIMLVVYLTKTTKYITLIPTPGLVGFLFTVGLTILFSQLGNGFGISVHASEKLYETVISFLQNLPNIQWYPTLFFSISLAFLFGAKKRFPHIPGVIILTIVGIGIGLLIKHHYIPPMLLLVDKYPNVTFALRNTSWISNVQHIYHNGSFWENFAITSLVIAIITILETNIAAKIAHQKTKVGYDRDQEVLGNALANIGSGLLGGLPATAVLVRTSLNIDTGATSKASATIAALGTFLICLFLFNELFRYLPMPIIAAILAFTAIRIMDFKEIVHYYHIKPSSFVIIVITIAFSVLFNTIVGIIVGTLACLLVFIKRATYSHMYVTIFRNHMFVKKTYLAEYIHEQQDGDIVLVKLRGDLNYLNAEASLHDIEKITKNKTLILSCEQLLDIDIDGYQTLSTIIRKANEGEIDIYLTGLKGDTKHVFEKIQGFEKLYQKNKIFTSNSEALDLVKSLTETS